MRTRPATHAEVMRAAREFMTKHFDGLVNFHGNEFSDEVVKQNLMTARSCTWEEWEEFCAVPVGDPFKSTTSSAPTIGQVCAQIRRTVGEITYRQKVRLKPHEEIVRAELNDNCAIIVISCVTLEERARVDIVKRRGVKVLAWTHDPDTDNFHFNSTLSFTVWESDDPETYQRWGTVNTPQRHMDKVRQFEECYRPGTEKSPMDGPNARMFH